MSKVRAVATELKADDSKWISNCKLLAEWVLSYEIEGVKQKINENLTKLKNFFKTTSDAFYCVLCDGEN